MPNFPESFSEYKKNNVTVIKLLDYPSSGDCICFDIHTEETLNIKKEKFNKLKRITIGEVETSYFLIEEKL